MDDLNKDITKHNKETAIKKGHSKGNKPTFEVNRYSLKPPRKDDYNEPKLSKDNYPTLYERQMQPIINASTLELTLYNTFLKAFNNPKLEALSTKEICIEKKYTFVEAVYLLYHKALVTQPHITSVINKSDKVSLSSVFHLTFTHYCKRFVIIERYLRAFESIQYKDIALSMCSAILDDAVNKKVFYLNAFFNPDFTEERIINDITFILNKVKSKDHAYKHCLRHIYAVFGIYSLPDNTNELNRIEGIMTSTIRDFIFANKDNRRVHTTDIEMFLFFYQHYASSWSLDGILCLTPEQRLQLTGYFEEMYRLIRLLLMNALTRNRDILVAVSNLEFLPRTNLINISLKTFMESNTCSQTVFSNILKSFTKISFHLVNYFYRECTGNPNIMMLYMMLKFLLIIL